MMHQAPQNAAVKQTPTAPQRRTLGAEEVRITALGGLGEIGMNCLLLEQRGSGREERMLVDCGALFRDGQWGVDAYGPRLDSLLDAPDALVGIALTHGHEDHIGALWTLALALGPQRSSPIEVVGPAYAVALCRRRLEEYPRLQQYLSLRVAPVGSRFSLGSFAIESVRVTHSTPDASALAITTVAGCVVHSGDFKLDPTPRTGQCSDDTRLKQLGDAGVRLLLADSTNALSEGHTRSEAVPAAALMRLVGAARGRVIVGLFASNVDRVDAAATAAMKHGRRLCLLGRSLQNHVALSLQLGRLTWPSNLLIAPEQARESPHPKLLYLATGTQGEPRAALRRLADGNHHQLQLEQGDTVLMSCRTIPGMDREVVALTNDLERRGATVISRLQQPDIHVSGHARRDELTQLLQWLRPQAFIPLHGTSWHLHAHAQLARQLQVPQIEQLRNGGSVSLDTRKLKITDGIDAGLVAYRAGRAIRHATLHERRRLGHDGLLVAALHATTPARVSLRAFGLNLNADELDQLQAVASAACRKQPLGRTLAQPLRLTLRRLLANMLGYRPHVEVIAALGGE